MERYEVVLGVETVHLDEPVLIGRRSRSVEDEEDEVAVLLHLGALTELLRILERQRMEAKDLPQERHLTLVGLQEVEPEVLAGG